MLFVPLHCYLIYCVVVVVVVLMLLSASSSRLIYEALCTTNKCKATAAHGTAVVNLRTISGLRRNQLWFDVDQRSAKNLKPTSYAKLLANHNELRTVDQPGNETLRPSVCETRVLALVHGK